MDGEEIVSTINTTPTVWGGVEAETGRTYVPEATGVTYGFTTGEFRNLQLISELFKILRFI